VNGLRRRLDPWIVVSSVFLIGIGVLAVFSASTPLGAEKFGDSYVFLKRHLVRLMLGAVLFFIALFIKMETLRKWAPVALLVSTILLGLSLGASEVRNTHRFVSVASVSLQPVEMARVSLVIFLAALLASAQAGRTFTTARLLVALGAILLPGILVFLQPSFSCAVALLLTGLVVIFVAGLPLRYVVAGAVVGLPVLLLVAHSHEYQWQRLVKFYDGKVDPLGHEWQLTQSLIALGSGGFWGAGFGGSIQKKFFLPDAHTDFVFAIFGEERGFAGTSLVLLAYLAILWRGFQTAGRAQERFCSYVAAGLTAGMGVFVFGNLAVVTGLVPTTGLPLPFLSYGGSALVMNMFSVGLLSNIRSRIPARGRRPGALGYRRGMLR